MLNCNFKIFLTVKYSMMKKLIQKFNSNNRFYILLSIIYFVIFCIRKKKKMLNKQNFQIDRKSLVRQELK